MKKMTTFENIFNHLIWQTEAHGFGFTYWKSKKPKDRDGIRNTVKKTLQFLIKTEIINTHLQNLQMK